MTPEKRVRPHLVQIAQPVADLERAVAFYRDVVGLGYIATFDPPGLAFFRVDAAGLDAAGSGGTGEGASTGEGSVRLMLDAIPGAFDHPGSPIYLGVADIEAAVRGLEQAGVAIEEGPTLIHRDETGDFGVVGTEDWMAFFRDPDGNILAFVERRPAA